MTGTPFDPNGYDRDGLDSEGFDVEGVYQRADELISSIFMGEHQNTGTALDQDGHGSGRGPLRDLRRRGLPNALTVDRGNFAHLRMG